MAIPLSIRHQKVEGHSIETVTRTGHLSEPSVPSISVRSQNVREATNNPAVILRRL